MRRKLLNRLIVESFNRVKKGVTLIELLLYMGLLSIFLVILTDLFVAILNVRSESEAISTVEQDGRFITARFEHDIARATSISSPASFGVPSTSLSLVVGGFTYSYSLNAGNLQLANNLGTNNFNSSESTISNLSFEKIGNSGGKESIIVKFRVASKTIRQGTSETKDFQVTAARR